MKKINNINKKNFFKKIFIKICRILGFEIIDQSNFYVPTQEKFLNENLNVQGKKSITLPLGETKISRKVKALTVIYRSCTNINMLTQNKKRLFDREKSEYTFRSLNSIILSLNLAKKSFPHIEFDIVIIDYNSKRNNLEQMQKQLNKSLLKNSIISLDPNEFRNEIKKINAENKNVTENQISNMSNIHKSLLLAKKQCEDLIYFVEDDYVHEEISIHEMLLSFERISTQLKEDVILFPTDYPYLYAQNAPTYILLGNKRHWRKIDQSLGTLLLSKKLFMKYWENFNEFATVKSDPAEKPLHRVYEKENCFSPIPSLAIHCTNINSIYGLSPNVDWETIWENAKLE